MWAPKSGMSSLFAGRGGDGKLTLTAPPLIVGNIRLTQADREKGPGARMDAVVAVFKTLPLVAFVAWCLWGVDWRRTWPILAAGGWVPLVLIGVMAGVVWAFVFPSSALVFGFMYVHNVLWQLGAVALL